MRERLSHEYEERDGGDYLLCPHCDRLPPHETGPDDGECPARLRIALDAAESARDALAAHDAEVERRERERIVAWLRKQPSTVKSKAGCVTHYRGNTPTRLAAKIEAGEPRKKEAP